jgi:hypothetical protein
MDKAGMSVLSGLFMPAQHLLALKLSKLYSQIANHQGEYPNTLYQDYASKNELKNGCVLPTSPQFTTQGNQGNLTMCCS